MAIRSGNRSQNSKQERLPQHHDAAQSTLDDTISAFPHITPLQYLNLGGAPKTSLKTPVLGFSVR